MRSKAPNAARSFRIPWGSAGIAYVLIFPVILCAIKIYYSEPLVLEWAPWLLASGPIAYAVLRWGFRLKPTKEIEARA
jgi:hypothetical protein